MKNNKRKKVIILASIGLLLLAIGIETIDVFSKENFNFNLEYINTKDIAKSKIKNKIDSPDTSQLLTNIGYDVKQKVKKEKVEEVEIPNLNKEQKEEVKRLIWRLPTEVGTITQYPSYFHTAYDITSPRGYSEAIYPIAEGTISSMYYDYAGALIVTILHDENGQKYTSQYVHLSRFADGLNVGQQVDTNTIIGYMGASGIATGVHLHITLLDCALYQDGNCPDLNAFYNYGRLKASEGYLGLGNKVYTPISWNQR